MAPLVTAGVSDEVAQEFQTPIGPHTLGDVKEPTPDHPATFKDPSTPAQIVLDQHNLTLSPSQQCKVRVKSRDRDSPHRDQSKIDIVVPQLQFDDGHMGRRKPSADCMFPRGNRNLFWSHTRNDGARLQEYGHALRGSGTDRVGAFPGVLTAHRNSTTWKTTG